MEALIVYVSLFEKMWELRLNEPSPKFQFPDRTETKSLEPTALIAVATGGVYLERCHTDIVFETHSSHAWLCLCSRASCMLSYHN